MSYRVRGIIVSIYLLTLLAWVPAYAISADDFIPPVQAEESQKTELLTVKAEANVKTETDVDSGLEITKAQTLQDAINKIVNQNKVGCQLVQISPEDGVTFVATGMGTYNPNYENVVASRIEQRNAYVAAFMNAKREMAMTAGEITVRGATNFDRKLERLDTAKKALTNIETELSEEQIQTVRKVLKGYVTYSVLDDETKGRVYVTLVSSPKTRGRYNRNGTDGITADSLRGGLNMLIAEIKNGLVPPVGGRIIDVPGTGEVAFVGFGSSIVRKDEQPDVQAELDLEAERIAGMRAVDALAGIILGDDTLWEGHVDEHTRKQVKDFETVQQSDQTTKDDTGEIKEYEKRVQEMRNVLSSSSKIQSLRKGVLPPGIMRQTDIDEHEYFAYGIAVYIPSVTDLARQASREMDDAQIIQSPNKQRIDAPTSQGKQDTKLEMKKGPSGVVQQSL